MKIFFRIVVVFLFATILIMSSLSCKRQEESTVPSEKITIAYPLSMYSVLYQIAYAKGYFRAEGLEVIPQIHEFGKLTVNAMVEGKADLAISGDTVLMFAIAGGKKIRIVAENLTSKRNNAIIARRDRGITTPRHLEGRSIGVTMGTTGQFFLDSFLTVNGIDKKKVKLIAMTPEQMKDALAKGSVDAVSVWQPYITQLELALGNSGVVFYDVRIYSDMVCLSATQEFVAKHPETIKKVLKALLTAERFVKDHPDESQRIVSEALKIDKALLAGIWDNLDFRVTLQQSLLVSLEDQSHWAQENGLVENREHPNYLDFIYMDALQSIKPEAVKIIR
ncbi:MAG: ABC transporter substrate-binding protein [Syntrophales bacterium]